MVSVITPVNVSAAAALIRTTANDKNKYRLLILLLLL
jgi:hypothetical protein